MARNHYRVAGRDYPLPWPHRHRARYYGPRACRPGRCYGVRCARNVKPHGHPVHYRNWYHGPYPWIERQRLRSRLGWIMEPLTRAFANAPTDWSEE